MQELISDIPMNHNDEVDYVFKSALVGSVLMCKYSKGTATFKSDSMSTIAIVKEFINTQFNERGREVSVKWDTNDLSIPHMIQRLKPLFEEHKSQSVKFKIVPALKELQLQVTYLEEFMCQIDP